MRPQERVSDEPLVMYYVVRKDVPLPLERAMPLAGAAAVACRDELAADPRFAGAFEQWSVRPRKVALRASGEELDELSGQLAGVLLEPGLLCLPPVRRSDRPALLAGLRPFTDAPRARGAAAGDEAVTRTTPLAGAEPQSHGAEALVYAIRPGVIRTTGKAMAQAGHAALLAADALDADASRRWRAAGHPGVVRLVDDDGEWERLRQQPGALVVTDAGLTQVAAGTETVIALLPAGRDGYAGRAG
jgi:peptidyl-tRNA hydrolase